MVKHYRTPKEHRKNLLLTVDELSREQVTNRWKR